MSPLWLQQWAQCERFLKGNLTRVGAPAVVWEGISWQTKKVGQGFLSDFGSHFLRMFFQASSFQRTELLEVEKDVQVGPQILCRCNMLRFFKSQKTHKKSPGNILNAQARVARVASFVSAMF